MNMQIGNTCKPTCLAPIRGIPMLHVLFICIMECDWFLYFMMQHLYDLQLKSSCSDKFRILTRSYLSKLKRKTTYNNKK